nr:MAG TPA: hypothetical protein [Caudoviricetes sp.]
MNWIEVLTRYQSIISALVGSTTGAILGFCLSYFSSRSGKIKLIVKNNYLSEPFEGIEKIKRNGNYIATDYYHKSTEYITLNLEILFINTSTVNKVITDIELESTGTDGTSLVGTPLIEVDTFINGNKAESLFKLNSHSTEYFHMISLKAGEAKLIKALAFFDKDFFEEIGGLKEIKIQYIQPERKKEGKKHKRKFEINKWLKVEK